MSSKHLDQSDRKVDQETVIGEAFLTNSIRVVNDTDILERPMTAEIMHREGITSFAHVPITIEDTPIGVLSAFSRRDKNIFTEEFIEVFQSVAAQLGIAWRNARQTERIIASRQQERELEIAKNIQLGLLPPNPPEVRGASLAGICVAAYHVGGDYYDYLVHDDGTLDVVIADVSGHNIGAALIMAEARTFIQAEARNLEGTHQIMAALNSFFFQSLVNVEMFITMFYVKYVPETRKIIYSNAGHNLPLIWRDREQRFQSLDAQGFIFGIVPDAGYEEKLDFLEPGDFLCLYTDGITEAKNEQGTFFGEERLCSLLREHHRESPQDMIDRLLERLHDFSGTSSFRDDVSLVIMRVTEDEKGEPGADGSGQ